MKIKLVFCLLLSILYGKNASSQSLDFPMNPLPSSEWNMGQWKEVSEINFVPNTTQMGIKSGFGTIFSNSSGAILQTKNSFSEFKVKFEIMQSENGECTLLLQDTYQIRFQTPSNLAKANFGSIILKDGSFKRAKQSVGRTFGLWNTIELSFIPAQNGQVARIEYLNVNGISVQENVFLSKPFEINGMSKNKETSISITNEKGSTALRNIAYLAYEDKKPVTLSNLTYTLQETNSDDPDFTNTSFAAVLGKAKDLSFDVPNDYTRYKLTYKGDLEISETNVYAFTAVYTGQGYLYIDDKLIAGGKFTKVREPQTGLVELQKGIHTIKYVYQRVWWAPVLGLYVSSGSFRPYPLSASRSVPVAKEDGGIYENPKGFDAQIIRSFMMHKGEKKTEVVSVGESSGLHYSFDLGTGNLLAAWRGDFADVTEMWFQRGEPQIIQPLGLVTQLNGGVQDFDAYMSDLEFDKYTLGPNGRPTFNFNLGNAKISKSFKPEESALSCQIKIESKNSTDHIIDAGKSIQKLTTGVYKVDDHYLFMKDNVEIINVDEDLTQLISHVATGKHEINYKIAW